MKVVFLRDLRYELSHYNTPKVGMLKVNMSYLDEYNFSTPTSRRIRNTSLLQDDWQIQIMRVSVAL